MQTPPTQFFFLHNFTLVENIYISFIHTKLQTHTDTNTHRHIHTHKHTHTHTHTHTNTYTYTYTHTHTDTRYEVVRYCIFYFELRAIHIEPTEEHILQEIVASKNVSIQIKEIEHDFPSCNWIHL